MVCISAALRAASVSTAPSDEIVELPKFVVTDSRELPPPESWRYGTIRGFEILSNASDRATQRLISDFQLFREAVNLVWPMPEQLNTPLLLILCGKANKFDEFVPTKVEGTPDTARASVYLKGRKRSAIVIDMQSATLSILDVDGDLTDLGMDSSRIAVDHHKQLYREYIHSLLSRAEPRLPAWFEEGLSQVIMRMRVDPKLIEFGRVQQGNEVPAGAEAVISANAAAAAGAEDGDFVPQMAGVPAEDVDFNIALSRRALLPMATLFAMTHESAAARNPLGNNVWAKQSYAFVHLCMFGQGGKWKKPFGQFLMRSVKEPVTEQVFKDCFKMSYKDMALLLRGYLQFTDYTVQEYRAKKGSEGLIVPDKLELRDATPSEVGFIKGQAKMLAGHVDAARTEYIAPYIRGHKDGQLLAALGLLERAGGKDDRALKFLNAAVAAKTTEPDAYVELTRMELDAAVSADGAKKTLTDEQVMRLSGLLRRAMTLPPANVAPYELLVEVFGRSTKKLTKDDIMPLIAGVQRFPARLRLVHSTAVFCADAGLYDAAHSLVDHGLKYAPDAGSRGAFQALKAKLPPESPQPASPAPAEAPATPAQKTASAK